MRGVARPAKRLTEEQKKLLADVNRAIERARVVAEREEEKVWAAVQKARVSGIPDVQLCRATGLNRSTLQNRLGPRPGEPELTKSDGV